MIRSTIVIVFIMVVTSGVSASVTTYTNKAEWEAAVGSFTTLDFAGGEHGHAFPPDTYSHLGVTFTGQQVLYIHSTIFQNDGEGIIANNNTLWAYFDTPQRAIAVDFPGIFNFQLWRNGELLYTSPLFLDPFAGLISGQSFDAVFLYRELASEYVWIDDLHFASLPAPGALALFGLGALVMRRRRST